MAGELIQDHLNKGDEVDSYLVPLDDVKPVEQEKNELDDFLVDLEEPKQVNATVNVHNAKNSNPDQAAKALDLANKTGLPHDTVERNFDTIDKNTKSEEDNTTVQNSSSLQKYLADLSNAKVSSDDIGTLDKIQKTIEDFGGWLVTPQGKSYVDMTLEERRQHDREYAGGVAPEEFIQTSVASAIRTLGIGLSGTGEMLESSARQLDRLLTGGSNSKAEPGEFGYYLTPSTWLQEAGKGGKYLADLIDVKQEDQTSMLQIAGATGQIATQAMMTMANPELGMTFLFAMGADQQAEAPVNEDDPAYLRDMKIMLGALGTGISEKFSLDFLMRKVPPEARGKFAEFVKDKVASGGVEATQEVLEGMWHDLVKIIGHDPEGDIFNWDELIQSAKVAFGGAVTFRTLFQTLLPGKARGGHVQAAEARVEQYKNLKDTVLESKTFERHKGKFEEFVDTSLEDATDPNVYFDAEEINTFFQSREESPQEVLTQLGVDAETWGQAVSSGGDVKVPLSKFLTLADSEYYDPMLQDIRTNLGDETLREAVQVSEVQAKEIFAETDRILAERDNAEELRAGGDEVRTLVREQLVATGKFDTEISDRYAALHEAFAITLASKLDVTPIEAYNKAAGLKVQAGVTTDTTKTDVVFNQEEDKRAVPQEGPRERRSKAREAFAELSKEELIDQILAHELTGIKGRKAFEIDVVDAKAVGSIDADSLKWVNDNLSPDHGDALLQAVADALEAETENAYHISGDEYYVLGDSQEEIQSVIEKATEKLSKAVITAEKPDGSIITLNGLNITHGLGDTKNVADQKLKSEKTAREQRGERATRGEPAFGSTVEPSKGNEGDSETFFQLEKAYKNHMGLWSAVEQAVLDMPLPQWKQKSKGDFTEEERLRLRELSISINPRVTLYNSPEAIEFDALTKKAENALPAANGNEIWAKLKKTPGVKKEELLWLGIEDYLASKKKFTRDEVATFVRNNGVEIEEVVADENGAKETTFDWEESIWDDSEAWDSRTEDLMYDFDNNDAEQDIYNNVISSLITKEESYIRANMDLEQAGLEKDADIGTLESDEDVIAWMQENFTDEIRNEFEEAASVYAEEEYKQNPQRIYHDRETDVYIFGSDDIGYVISTGNYGNLGNVIRSGDIYSYAEAEIQAEDFAREEGLAGDEHDPDTARWSEYVTEGDHDNYRELKITLPSLQGKGSETTFYNDVHFSDANLVTFLRLTDRTLETSPGSGAEFNSTYFIEEFQSDWHQQGRQQGYQLGEVDPGEIDAQANELRTEMNNAVHTAWESLSKKLTSATEAGSNTYRLLSLDITLSKDTFNARVVDAIKEHSDTTSDDIELATEVLGKEKLNELRKDYKESERLYNLVKAERDGVLDAPFKGDGWISLGLKRAIIDAVEQGKDSIAWADANVLSDRWSDQYKTLYETQYDKKMPSIVKKLTKQKPRHFDFSGIETPKKSEFITGEFTGQGYWTIPITDELRERVKQDGFALYQKKTDTAKGQIQFPGLGNEAVVTLFESSDLSTFLHESGHFFLQAYRDLAAENPEIQADLDTLTKWMGVDNAQQIGLEEHEMFARAFENYLYEGKAPNVELQTLFDRFKAWLLNVYKSATQFNIELNDEVRNVMNRMLATEEAIKEAEFANSLLPVYTSAEAAGMSKDEYADYKKAYERATNAAQTDTDVELLARLKRERKDAWKTERNSIRDEVLNELYSQPAVQARWFFMRGTLPNGDKLPGIEEVKLSREALIEMYGEELDALWRELPFGKYSVWTKEDSGVHPDEIAPMFGFASGDEMVKAMVATKGNLNNIATEEADLLMRRQHGDPDSQQAIADLALEKVQNEERSNFLSVELRALEKRAGLENTPRNVIKRAALRIINETRIADIKEHSYLRTSNKWARKALEFATDGKFEEAADAKRKQLLNQAIYIEAIKARKYTETKTKYLKKFDSPGVRKNLARDYLDQIDSVLEAYDLKKSVSLKEVERRKSLNEWINSQVEQGLEVVIPSDLIERARKRSYKDLPYEEFIGLVDSVKNIEHIARFKQKLIVGKEKRDFAETIDGLVTTALENNTWKQQKLGLKTDLDKAKSFSREFMASHVKMEFLLQQLDGNVPNGPWWESVFRPLVEAEDNEIVLSQQYMHELNAIFELYGSKGRAGLYKETLETTAELGRNIKRAELISIGLNWGNEGNRTALLRGEDWTQTQIEQVLDKHMTEQDWNTVQSTWNLIDSLWPDISTLQKELTGVVPAKVEATTIKTKYGSFQGGYYPLQYDVERSIKAFKYEEKMTVDEMFGGNYTQPSTRKGHTIERVGSDGMAVKLDLDVIGTHIVNVIHDLTHRKAVLQADHILQNKQVAETIIAITNRELYQHVRPWLAGIASDKRPFSGWMEQAVGRLRRGATAVNMGWKFTTAIVQPLGYLQSVDLLGEKYALKGLKAFYGNPLKAKNVIDEVFSKSVMMANRSKTFDRDIRDSIRRIKGDDLNAKIQRSLFSHIGFMDYSVSIPTWVGAYEKSMDTQRVEGKEINEANAIAYADSVVRMSQSAGGAKDLAAIQRGSEYQRSFTMFYSYFSVLHNLIRRRAQVSNKAGFSGANVTRTTMSMLYLVVLPAVLAELIVGRGPDEEKDEEFMPWAATTSLAYPFMTMVGVRDFANALASGYTYQATPILDAADSFIKSGEGIGDAFTDFAGITDEEFDRQDVKNMAMTSGYLFGLPARQLYTSGEHLYAVLNDEEEFSLYEFLYRNKRN